MQPLVRTRSLLLSVTILAACGGGTTSTGGPDAPDSPETKKAFHDLTRDEKLEFMASRVQPEMAKLFQEHDSKGYTEFQCVTCHGEDFQKVDYKMPNALYALPEADPVKDAKEYNAEITDFMVKKVVPKMTELLGEPVSCHTCHPKS